MWYIVSKSGLRGIETYETEHNAWIAAEMRNRLINQGWHPVRVAAQATLFLAARPRSRRAVFALVYLFQKNKCGMFVKK